MKLLVLCALVALAAAAPMDAVEVQPIYELDGSTADIDYNNSILINLLLRQLWNFLRNLIANGSINLGIPPLDPLIMDGFRLEIPSGVVNLNLDLKNVNATGLAQFVVRKNALDLRALTFDVELALPALQVEAALYNLLGDIYTIIPLYGSGRAMFKADDFSIRAKFFLKQSDDERSVIIDKIENSGLGIPYFESHLSGVIGGGDIDGIVNAIIEEVLIGYLNRFHGVVGKSLDQTFYNLLSPLLEGLDTWRFLAPLLPRN